MSEGQAMIATPGVSDRPMAGLLDERGFLPSANGLPSLMQVHSAQVSQRHHDAI
jgi:hypothetical protein